MKTTVWTYRNKKRVDFQEDRFYVIKNKKEYDKVIDRLLNIDAVSSPYVPSEDKVQYPIVLELQPGFAPNLIEVSPAHARKVLKSEVNSINKELDQINALFK